MPLTAKPVHPCPPLVVERLAKRFRGSLAWRGVRAVEDLSFSVDRGTVLGIIGPNGSGKTTALRCSLGYLKPSSGSVRIFGQPALTSSARRNIGFAPERFEPSPMRTGRETLLLLGQMSGLARLEAAQRADQALERFGLISAANRPVRGYSKGMRRRLAIAQALQHDPELVILDEPFDGLDPLGVLFIRDEIAARARAGAAIVVSSHQLADVEAVATDLAVVHLGRVVARGSASEVLDRHGVSRLEIAGLDDSQWPALEAWIQEHGGALIQRSPARDSLERLFQRAVGRESPEDRRDSAAEEPR